MAAPGPPRRRKIIGHRRRVEDDGEEEGGPETIDIEDDSLTEGSIASDEHDQADDSDTSNVDEMSPTVPNTHKPMGGGSAKPGFRRKVDAVKGDTPSVKQVEGTIEDTQILLGRVSLADEDATAGELNFDDLPEDSASKEAAPIIVRSSPVSKERLPVQEQKRREHEEYRRKRDEDPTFVPNRGAFFLHDHRHAGPAANGFRPFPRGARGRGRGAFGGPFAPVSHIQTVPDPTTNGPWAHDMHEMVTEPPALFASRNNRYVSGRDGPPSGKAPVPTAPLSDTHINRAMSTEKHVANVAVRVYIPSIMSTPKTFTGVRLNQYTKLPDHRPPLRRDKPVRISLPYHHSPIMPRYIYPPHDRAFIFIPRALRPNQQRGRGKGARSTAGSVGPFSRRTSVYGSYYGSVYTPSIAMSRRSSITHDFGREYILSPTGSSISRPPLPADHSRPVVRLPPLAQAQPASMLPPPADAFVQPAPVVEASINDLPQPQTHPLPQKPTFQETRSSTIPMHQPRPQKAVSIENIEPPAPHSMNAPPSYQQAFHHQVPPQMTNPYAHETHTRHPSYQSQSTSLTPLSQIPERAIHAAPFQPTHYPQPGFYGQPYPVMQQMQPPQGYYYPQQYGGNMGPNASAPAFVPASQQGPYDQPVQGNPQDAQPHSQGAPPQGLIVQEMGGTMYFYDPNQMPVVGYPPYPPAYNPGMVNMGGVVTPDQNGLFYPPPAPGMVYLNS
ncbi:CASC3/Barentsz eIF4AIII binding-domain-containing protein [Schizothecium vesticola]|uniref:CASC3/Barentsz eIF4AIII binding-domain-containing protein n=1 Tax=Schizothecium vesticola TaxID=314040 RepID=A0AA40FBP6_9PEZI|nr:CASC3/Barentsz eIF4AIII binding-domain-containing protein [Schizothecium vesticola]